MHPCCEKTLPLPKKGGTLEASLCAAEDFTISRQICRCHSQSLQTLSEPDSPLPVPFKCSIFRSQPIVKMCLNRIIVSCDVKYIVLGAMASLEFNTLCIFAVSLQLSCMLCTVVHGLWFMACVSRSEEPVCPLLWR